MNSYSKIFLFLCCSFLFSDMIKPQNGSNINYIHVLFEWEQINDAEHYDFRLWDQNDSVILSLSTDALAHYEKDC